MSSSFNQANMENIRSKFLEFAEEWASFVFRRFSFCLPHVARFLLVSSFIEDGLRMITQFNGQKYWFNDYWSCGFFLATLIVLLNMTMQLGGVGLVLFRKYAEIGVALLLFSVVFQTIIYGDVEFYFLMRNISVCGGLILLMADCYASKSNNRTTRDLFAGLPTLGDENKPQSYMQFCGRLLITLMYIVMIRFRAGFMLIIFNILTLIIIVCLMIGFKTKLASLIALIYLGLWNFTYNTFWLYSSSSYTHDYLKYDFFQTCSVMGGLVMVVSLGPGGVSLDEYRKKDM